MIFEVLERVSHGAIFQGSKLLLLLGNPELSQSLFTTEKIVDLLLF